MFIKLIILFTLVPMVELMILIKLGTIIGILPTIALVALTGIVGVSLARNQGLRIIGEVKDCISRGQLPADSLIDGLLILIGGAMLLTPGLLTDLTGFSLIIPLTRIIVRKLVKRKIRNYLRKNGLNIESHYQFDSNDI